MSPTTPPGPTGRLEAVTVLPHGSRPVPDDVARTRGRLITDILKANQFMLVEHKAVEVCRLTLGLEHGRVLWQVSCDEEVLRRHLMSLSGLRKIIKDYNLICDQYQKAVQGARAQQVEAIDMGRRGVHNEGAEALQQRLAHVMAMDFETARRLFALICTL